MGVKTVWICDGCSAERVHRSSDSTDWKSIGVTVEGSNGYPTNGVMEGKHEYMLCPACQHTLVVSINPRHWPRVLEPSAPQVTS